MSSDKAPSAGDGEARAAGVEGMVGQSSSPTRPPPGAGPRANTGGFVGAAEVPEVTREEDAPLADDELLVKDAEDEVVDEEVVLEDVTLLSPASPLLPAARAGGATTRDVVGFASGRAPAERSAGRRGRRDARAGSHGRVNRSRRKRRQRR